MSFPAKLPDGRVITSPSENGLISHIPLSCFYIAVITSWLNSLVDGLGISCPLSGMRSNAGMIIFSTALLHRCIVTDASSEASEPRGT